MGSLIRLDSPDAQEQQRQLAEIEEIMKVIARKLGIMGYPKRRLVLKSKKSLELARDFLDTYRIVSIEKHVTSKERSDHENFGL